MTGHLAHSRNSIQTATIQLQSSSNSCSALRTSSPNRSACEGEQSERSSCARGEREEEIPLCRDDPLGFTFAHDHWFLLVPPLRAVSSLRERAGAARPSPSRASAVRGWWAPKFCEPCSRQANDRLPIRRGSQAMRKVASLRIRDRLSVNSFRTIAG